MSHTMLAGIRAEWRAVCVERRMHGSVGGAGPSSKEAVRAHPTRRQSRLGERRLAACRALPTARPDAPKDSAEVIAVCSSETKDLPAA
jgi:hypothetical protein